MPLQNRQPLITRYPRRQVYQNYTSWDNILINFGSGGERIYPSGRQLPMDWGQPTFGYFSGGGWAFGRVERTGQRIHPSAYQAYMNGQTSFLVQIYDERTNTVIDAVRYQTTNPATLGYIPPYSSLRPVDRGAVAHDLAYANALRADLAGGSMLQRWRDESAADAAFLAVIRSSQPAYPDNPDLVVYESRYRNFVSGALGAYAKVRDALLVQFQAAVDGGYAALADFEAWVYRNGGARIDLGSGLPVYMALSGTIPSQQDLATADIIRRMSIAQSHLFEAGLGSTIGGSLGNYLAGSNVALGVLYGSVLGEIGERLALTLVGASGTNIDLSGEVEVAVSGSFASDVWGRIQGATIGSISSMLAAELGQALGLEGFGAQILNTVNTTVIGKVITNLTQAGATSANIFDGFGKAEIFEAGGVGNLALSAVGTFLGARLGAMVVAPTTQAGAALSSIGSAAGAYIAITKIGVGLFGSGKLGSALGNLIVPGIGAFVGFVLGALIGNLFGRKKPKIPTATAEVFLDYTSDQFQLGAMSAANGGNLDLVRDMATSSRDTLNGFLTVLAGGMALEATGWASGLYRNGRWLAMDAGVQSFYGHTGGQLWVKLGSPNAAQQNVATADDAVSKGVMWSLDSARIIGGDIFAKRALTNSSATDLASLLGDLQLASDYRYYATNRDLINGYLTDAYASLTEAEQSYYAVQKVFIDKVRAIGYDALHEDEREYYNDNYVLIEKIVAALEAQAIANPWIITLQRVAELKLDQWAASDFYGGLPGFMMSMGLEGSDTYMESVSVSAPGGALRISIPEQLAGGPLAVLAQSDSNGWAVTVNDLAAIGYVFSGGSATAGNDFTDFTWHGAGVGWSGQGGDDIVTGGDGNDAFYGGDGWDWLSGAGGADLLEGGAGNDVILGRGGADNLFGQAGDDYLAGSGENDVLYGGEGNDTLAAGDGADYVDGQEGDDTIVIERDANWGIWFPNASLYGGSGSDTLSFERYKTGQLKTLDPGAWALAFNPASAPAAGVTGVALSMLSFGGGATDANLVGVRVVVGGVENLIGSRLNDYLQGDAGDNRLFGGAGDDILDGYLGSDVLEGGAGADFMTSAGIGTLSYRSSNAGVFVDLGSGVTFGGDATGDRWASMEHLQGSRFADELKGDAATNTIEGAEGDDWLVASAGADTLNGGEGADTADYSSGGFTGVTVALGGQWAQAQTTDGATHTHNLIGIEHIAGSAGADTITLGSGAEFVTGGGGNDYLSGLGGADTYYFGRGDGWDTVYEDNTDNNTLSLAGDVRVSDLAFDAIGGAGGYFRVTVMGFNDNVTFAGNFAVSGNNRLKSIDLNGSGQIDVSAIQGYVTGGQSNDTLYGVANRSDLIVGHGGGYDSLYGAGPGGWESQGNVFIGGAGEDGLTGSVGDDQYVFDAGSNWDVIVDAGGEDTLVFGASVSADDIQIHQHDDVDLMVYYKGQGGLYEGVRIAGGGIRYIDAYTGAVSFNTVEFINAGGTWIDIRKLDIAWVDQYTYDGGWAPIVLDLQGDGLNLVSVDQSQVVSQLDSGAFARTGWVGPTDGLLAVDRDGNGRIDRLEEISFVNDAEGAKTDLEGLRGWDTNGDGKLSALDADWGKLKVWVDRNQNGRSTSGELRTLEEAGVTEIDLTGQATGYDGAHTRDNYVHNRLTFTWADGETGTAYDVVLARRLLEDRDLTRDEVRAAWGDGETGGQLGRLMNDPAAAAAAALQFTSQPRVRDIFRPREGLVADQSEAPVQDEWADPILPPPDPTWTEVNAFAEIDFSDHDNLYAEEEARWADALAGRRADSLDEDHVSVLTDPSLRPVHPVQDVSGQLARGGAFVRPTFESETSGWVNEQGEGSPTLGPRAAAPARAASAPDGQAAFRAPEVDPDYAYAAAAVLSAPDPVRDIWAPAPITLAPAHAGPDWWLELGGAGGGHGPFLLPDQANDVDGRRIEPPFAAVSQDEVLSQHQRLAQALAGFGPNVRGVGPAVWRRAGEAPEMHVTGGETSAVRWRVPAHDRMAG